MKENDIAVNYGRLPERLKSLDDASEIKSKQQDLVNNINKLDATLSRIPAPNMKAVSKYVSLYFLIVFCFVSYGYSL